MTDAAKSRYTFIVKSAATKPEIRSAVEKQFGVKVVKVRTMTTVGKVYRTGKKWMFDERPDGKKAIVEIKPGQKIDLFETKEVTEDKK